MPKELGGLCGAQGIPIFKVVLLNPGNAQGYLICPWAYFLFFFSGYHSPQLCMLKVYTHENSFSPIYFILGTFNIAQQYNKKDS